MAPPKSPPKSQSSASQAPQPSTPTVTSPTPSPPTSPRQNSARGSFTSPPRSPPLGPSARAQSFAPVTPSGLRNSLSASVPGNDDIASSSLEGGEEQWWTPIGGATVPRGSGQSNLGGHDETPNEHTRLLGAAPMGEDMPRWMPPSVGRTVNRGPNNNAGNNGKGAGLGGLLVPRPSISRNYDSFNSYLNDLVDSINGDAASVRSFTFPSERADDESDNETETSGTVSGTTTNRSRRKTWLSGMKKWAKKHGFGGRRYRIVSYYLPFLNWMPQYRFAYLKGDFLAAITMASFYIPMALSLASNLGHIPPLNGLYAFVFNPLIYGFLGTCPQMVVGPEAAGSLLTGQVVKENINNGNFDDEDGQRSAEVAGVVTFTAGLVILMAGLFRLGFLDNVLSRPFQRGFISAIGIVIFIDQLIPELGLTHLAAQVGGVSHGSCVNKVVFLFQHLGQAHALTTAVSLGSFAIIMICREIKNRLQPRFPNVAYIPDRFAVVVLSAILCWAFRWDEKGLEILGDIKTDGNFFPIHWPYSSHMHLKYATDAFSTSFIIALLGFFESSVAAKSLSSVETGPQVIHMHRSANRELVALGSANVIGGLFMALPAFGGYGRSKVNASTGGRTPMSSIILAFITVLCVLFMTPYFYYLPKGVLCAMISVVAYSLLEEIPPDVNFFIRIHGWSELLLMALIFFATILWNLNMGIAVGIGLSLLRVIRHATRPRIQILGRVPGTEDKFENAERAPSSLEFFEGCLIVKVPEPLTFANTGDLRERLRKLEDYHHAIAESRLEGNDPEHFGNDIETAGMSTMRSSFAFNSFSGPSGPSTLAKVMTGKSRNAHVRHRFVIFDVHGVTSLDGAGAQVVKDLVKAYVDHDVRVIFCRCPPEGSKVWKLLEDSSIVDLCGGREMFVDSVQDALAIAEKDRREAEGSGLISP